MNKHLLNKINQMSPEEIYMSVYQDELTGVLNRRAFTQFRADFGLTAVAIVDLDSLKFINDHHPDYHQAGDRMIQKLAEILVLAFGENNVFRLGGDEFVVVGFDGDIITARMGKLYKDYPFFSVGVGVDLITADNDLQRDKIESSMMGTRADRGLRPPWWSKINNWIK